MFRRLVEYDSHERLKGDGVNVMNIFLAGGKLLQINGFRGRLLLDRKKYRQNKTKFK